MSFLWERRGKNHTHKNKPTKYAFSKKLGSLKIHLAPPLTHSSFFPLISLTITDKPAFLDVKRIQHFFFVNLLFVYFYTRLGN